VITPRRVLFVAFAFVVLAAPVILVRPGFAQPLGAPAQLPPVLADYPTVTDDRLLDPAEGDWLMIRRTYDGWGYSPLDEITPENVTRLRPVWGYSTAVDRPHESAPVVNGGVMFITTAESQVIALDAVSGDELWSYQRPRSEDARVPHEVNRGVALWGDNVYFAAGEAVLVALDARSGDVVWETTVADNAAGYYTTLAPLVADGKVMVGASGGEYGVRGFVAAFDAEDGSEIWRAFMVPAPGEPGSETWPVGGDQWMTGGAPVWVTGNYDPETNLSFWGTGNGGPWMGDQRPGDNLHTASTVALDVETGEIRGHFQYHPNDSWDWDEVSPPILVDYERNGETVTGLINVARNGYLWFLERTDGPIRFVEGKPYVYQNVFTSLDPVSGRPNVDPERKPGTGKTANFCPGLHGGKNWPPIAFSPETRMIYIPANNNLCGELTGADDVTYTAGRGFTGTARGGAAIGPPARSGTEHVGEVQAWNVDTGELVWTHTYPRSPNWGGMLVTAGGVVFNGGTNDRRIHAFDAGTGELLWESPTPSGILAPPTSFEVDGKQYIAVLSGWGGDSNGMNGAVSRLFPGEVPSVPTGGTLWVYALD
jgi:alcohol dehydrogenase (cytochrome c)